MRVLQRTYADFPRGVEILLLFACVVCGLSKAVWAQRLKWHDEGFTYRRIVELPIGPSLPEAVVCDFLTQGALTAEQSEIAVHGNRERAAFQVLQLGPGDFCRVAFQTTRQDTRYAIYYGGKAASAAESPTWTSRVGLLFETRRWKACDLRSLESVRQAFRESVRIGSDYVPQVYQRFNPFDAEPGPFLTRYSGDLQMPLNGDCTFCISSQDCSFLLIDGQLVVSAPGAHGPDYQARTRGSVTLAEGAHRFEYFHAAQGTESCMVATWQLPGIEKPTLIPANVFRSERVAHVRSDRLEHRDDGYLPDFRVAVLGDIPSSEDPKLALVRVQFHNVSAKGILTNARLLWSFGDGQTSKQLEPGHVYLHPGPYCVSLQATRGSRTLQTQSRVQITRHFILDAKQLREEESLATYLESLEQYDAATLDPLGLTQLVRTYLEADRTDRAIAVAKLAFAADASAHTDDARWAIVSLVGPVLRDQLQDARTAAELWFAASRLIQRSEWRCACAVETADLLIHDLLLAAKAKPILDAAAEHLQAATPVLRSRYYRVAGDWYARDGKADDARASYRKAEAARELSYRVTERNAWRGAYSRSAEAHLRSSELDQARAELDHWQRDFPSEKCEGYLSFLLMRYWMARQKHEQAIAVASDLLVVNPASPYADRLVFLIASCEQELGHQPRAAAAYQSLISDYPGSPLVEQAKKELAEDSVEPSPPQPKHKSRVR